MIMMQTGSKIVTTTQMRQIEEYAINKMGIPSILLMENAAIKTIPHILEQLGGKGQKNALILCGPGNNGGDGYAITRLLHVAGVDVCVAAIGGKSDISADATLNREIIKNLGIPVYGILTNVSSNEFDLANLIKSSDIVIDAIFGTGLSKAINDIFYDVVEMANRYAKYILSVDIPTGVHSDTGHIMGIAINAQATITYGFIKPGLLFYPGASQAGQVFCEDISLPHYIKTDGLNIKMLNDCDIPLLLPNRPPDSHKGTFGHVRVIAGSRDMPGAAALCVMGAYRSGAGLVEACVVEAAAKAINTHMPEAVTRVVPDINGMYMPESLRDIEALPDVLLIGPGIGQGEEVKRFTQKMISESNCKMLIDADSLNNIAGDLSVLAGKDIAITPHPGEMGRLTGLAVHEITKNPIHAATSFAKTYNITVLLKGPRTVIADPIGNVYINQSGNSALAKAGSWDALAGIIAGLAAQGLTLFEACALGAYLHGKAGEEASKSMSEYSVTARDVTHNLSAFLLPVYNL